MYANKKELSVHCKNWVVVVKKILKKKRGRKYKEVTSTVKYKMNWGNL